MRLVAAIKEEQQSRDVRGKSLCNYQFVLKLIMLTAQLDRPKCFSMGAFVVTPIGKRAERLTCRESREQSTRTNKHTHTQAYYYSVDCLFPEHP